MNHNAIKSYSSVFSSLCLLQSCWLQWVCILFEVGHTEAGVVCERGKREGSERGTWKRRDGRKEWGGEAPPPTHTCSSERARPWTHPSTPPQTRDRASQKLPTEHWLRCALGAPHLAPQPQGRTGPSLICNPANSWVLRSPSRARHPQPSTGHRAPTHPLLGESFCLSPSSPSDLSYPGVCQEVQGRRQRQGSRKRRRAGGRISYQGHQRRRQGDHRGAAPDPLAPHQPAAPHALHFGSSVWWSRGRRKINP